MSNITLVLDVIEIELKEACGEQYLDCAKVVAIEAIAALIGKDTGTDLAVIQQKERADLAEQLTLGREARIIKLREQNQIRLEQ